MRSIVLSLLAFNSYAAADWLSSAADAKRSRFQSDETDLSRETAPDLKLLWKMQFDQALTSPVILGPIFTHRGIKELVFFADAENTLYSVDADLGRLFWKRHFDTKPTSGCKTDLTSGPVLAPYYGNQIQREEVATPRRSLFVLTGDGQLHMVRPADAFDLALPVQFVPPGSVASDLTLSGSTVSTNVTAGCEQPKAGDWSIRVQTTTAKPTIGLAKPESRTATAKGLVVTANDTSINTSRNGKTIWTVDRLTKPLAPVIANGLVFTVSDNTLFAYNLQSGVQIFSSGPNGSTPANASLALANAHVYFVAGSTIYCYGFPIEI